MGRSPARLNHAATRRGTEARGARRLAWLAAVPLAAALAAYSGSFHGPLIFDDEFTLSRNPHIRGLASAFNAATQEPHSPLTNRPLAAFTFAVNYALGELDVRGYHAVNLAIHLACCLVLLGVVRRTCETPLIPPRYRAAAPWIALAVTLVWAVHPLNSEAVVYITQRTELLAGLFLLLVMYCSIRAWEPGAGGAWQTAAVAACAAGMASKEILVAAPLLVPLYDLAFRCRTAREAWRQRWPLYMGLAATWLVLAALVFAGPPNPTVGTAAGVSAWHYLLTQAGVIVHYLRLSLWPDSLAIAYDWPIVRSLAEAAAPGLVVLGLLGAGAWAWRRHRWAGFLAAWFFLILAPTSSLLPIVTEPVAERRMYLPLAAVLALLAVAAIEAWHRWPRAKAPAGSAEQRRAGLAAAAALAGLAAALATATFLRVCTYASELDIWQDTVARCPNNSVSQLNLGCAWLSAGNAAAALAALDTSLALAPDDQRTHNNRGAALYELGRLAEAEAACRRALQLADGQYAEAYSNLALILADQGRLAEAEAAALTALEQNPNLPMAHTNYGMVLGRQGRIVQAAVHFTESLRLKPDDFKAHLNLGMALTDQQRYDEALARYLQALRLAPDRPIVHSKLATLHMRTGQLDAAAAHLAETLRLDPNYPQAHKHLGIVLTSQGQYAAGVELLSEALRRDPADRETAGRLAQARSLLRQSPQPGSQRLTSQ